MLEVGVVVEEEGRQVRFATLEGVEAAVLIHFGYLKPPILVLRKQ